MNILWPYYRLSHVRKALKLGNGVLQHMRQYPYFVPSYHLGNHTYYILEDVIIVKLARMIARHNRLRFETTIPLICEIMADLAELPFPKETLVIQINWKQGLYVISQDFFMKIRVKAKDTKKWQKLRVFDLIKALEDAGADSYHRSWVYNGETYDTAGIHKPVGGCCLLEARKHREGSRIPEFARAKSILSEVSLEYNRPRYESLSEDEG